MKKKLLVYSAFTLLLLNSAQIIFAQLPEIKCIGIGKDPNQQCVSTQIEFNQLFYFELSELNAAYDKPENIILYLNDIPLPYYTCSEINKEKKRIYFKLGLKGNDPNNTQKNIVDLIRKDFQNYKNNIPLRFGLGNRDGSNAITKYPAVNFVFFNAIYAIIISFVAAVLFIVIFYFLIKKGALNDDKMKTLSLRKFQLALWSFLIILCYFSLWLIFKEAPVLPASVLGLLSISVGIAIISSFIPENKTSNKSTGLKGLLVDNNDEITITRIQYVVFTLLFAMVFLYTAFLELRIYDFSTQQLILMGISGGGYLGLKTYYALK